MAIFLFSYQNEQKIVFFFFFFDGNQRVQLRNIYSKYFPLKVSLWLDTSIMDFVEIAFQ